MARTPATRAEAIEQLMRGYEESGMTRQQYCAANGIPVSTFAYHRKLWREQQQPKHQQQQLVRVHVEGAEVPSNQSASEGFTLTLAQGRRIEAPWDFRDQHLLRLIRIVEAA